MSLFETLGSAFRGITANKLRSALTLLGVMIGVAAVILLPPTLIFLVLMLNDKVQMGEHANTRWQNIACGPGYLE